MQPLSSVRRSAHALFGEDDTMLSRPKVAIKIAECIAEWTNVESMLGVFLGLLLHANGETTLAIYMALENRAAQLRMLEAAAEAELITDTFDIFVVLMEQHLRPIMRTRDRLAHWCWGYSYELPNDLLLMEPDEKTALHYAALHGPIEFDRTKIFVVTEKYLGASFWSKSAKRKAISQPSCKASKPKELSSFQMTKGLIGYPTSPPFGKACFAARRAGKGVKQRLRYCLKNGMVRRRDFVTRQPGRIMHARSYAGLFERIESNRLLGTPYHM